MAGGRKKKKIRSGRPQLLRVEMDFRVRFPLFFCIFLSKLPPLLMGVEGNYL
jgi:hypothetical protein